MTKPVSIAFIVLVVQTIGLILIVSSEQDCPVKCTCYQQENQTNINRQIVDCTEFEERDLIRFNNLSVDTTDLILRDGSWDTIDFGKLPSHLTKLITISIKNYTTKHLERHSDSIQKKKFEEVQNVSIQFTRISLIRKGMFDYFPKITHIILDHNHIDEIYKNPFSGLKNIEFINLSHNCIGTIEEDSFINIDIKTLDISNNKLKENHICLLTNKLTTTLVLPIKECPTIIPDGIGLYIFGFAVAISSCAIAIAIVGNIRPGKNKNVSHIVTVGKIKLDLREKLGRNVFKGEVTGVTRRLVAVKRSKLNPYIKEFKELDILVELSKNGLSNDHVIQHIITETDKKYRYIALIPVCDETLHNAIFNKNIIAKKYMATGRGSCLEQLADGLKFLHDHGVQHRDIKPENILIKYKGDTARFIIADFDLGHITGKNSRHRIKYGTMGWVAPELWRKAKRLPAVDVFSMGCVFYYVLAEGCHPFGEIDNLQQCQKNITPEWQPKLRLKIKGSREFKPALAESLINSMIEYDCKMRPEATWITQHPIFWSDEEISKFYLYNNIGKMVVDKKTERFQRMLRANSSEVYTGDWTSYLEAVVTVDVNKHFDKADICKLLRHIRNKTEHFDELSEELKRTYYYCCSEGVARYFNEKFPKLLLYTFQKKEELKQQYQM